VDMREILDTAESFIAGLGNKSNIDINNAVYIAKELLGLNLPLKFRGAGRHGVKCLRLYRILEGTRPAQKDQKAFHIGKILSEYDSRELMLMAAYLWNEGRSSLDKTEREEAYMLLQEKFGVTTEKERLSEPSAALASG